MFKQNLHIHTTYTDGADTPREMIEEAIKNGFSSIGFSEHVFVHFSPEKAQNLANYRAEILSLKEEYKGIFDIFCGLEYDFYSDFDTTPYDYTIGSVHYLDIDGTPLTFDRDLSQTLEYINAHFSGNSMAFAKKYFETVSQLPSRKAFDIIGHFDLITKNNEKGRFLDVSSKEYLQYGFDAIYALKGKIPFFEINTGAISRGYRTSPYPQREFLKEFKNCGFGAVITSDCHNKLYIDCFYNEAVELLREAGFSTKWILTSQGFREVSL